MGFLLFSSVLLNFLVIFWDAQRSAKFQSMQREIERLKSEHSHACEKRRELEKELREWENASTDCNLSQ